jgi:hypothetical protein
MTNDTESLLMYLFSIHVSSWVKLLLKSFAFIDCVVFLLLNFKSSSYILDVSHCQIGNLKIFSPSSGLHFHFFLKIRFQFVAQVGLELEIFLHQSPEC